MPTANARAVSILDALLNRASTATERQRVLDAYGTAGAWLAELRALTLGQIKTAETVATRSAVANEVNTTFTETP